MPKAKSKTKAQLITELEVLRLRCVELEAGGSRGPEFDTIESLQRSERELKLRIRIVEILLRIPDDKAYPQVLKILLEATGSKNGVFGYLDETGAYVVPGITADTGDTCPAVSNARVFPQETWGEAAGPRAIREKRTIWSNKPSTEISESHIPLRRHVSFPILHEGEVIGLVQVANKDTDYDEQDVAFLEAMAAAMAPALGARLRWERQTRACNRAEQALQEARQELENRLQEETVTLARVTKNLQDQIAARVRAEDRSGRQGTVLTAVGKMLEDAAICRDDEEVARTCLAVAVQLTGSKFGYLGQANQSGRFDVTALSNPEESGCASPECNATAHIRDMEIRGIWAKVLTDGQSHIVNEAVSGTGQPSELAGVLPPTNFLGVPLRQSGQIVGTIALAGKPSGYDATDLEAMEALAPVVVAALMRKRAEMALSKARQELSRREELAVLAQLAGSVDGELRHGRSSVRETFRLGLNRCRRTASSGLERLRAGLGQTGRADGPPRKVLVVSPRSAFQERVRSALQARDQVTMIETVNVGDEGLKAARDTQPDAVVVDVSSAGMGGLRTIALLRDQLSAARIIAVSPCDTRSAKIAARECGADRFVVESLQGREFVRAIRKAVSGRNEL